MKQKRLFLSALAFAATIVFALTGVLVFAGINTADGTGTAEEATTSANKAEASPAIGNELSAGLIAAFPLDGANGGKNIVTGSAAVSDQVVFMKGSNTPGSTAATEELTAENDSFISYQGIEGAKLFEEEYLSAYNNANPYADRAAKSNTMGLDIPTSAFAGVTKNTGFTITVNAYIENFYSGSWGRIFQLGDYGFESANRGQIYYAVNAVSSCEVGASVDILSYRTIGSILARQWNSITISVDPEADAVNVYVSGYQLVNGAIEYAFTSVAATAASDAVDTLIETIASDEAENWLGRSFWDGSDASVVGAVSNLSIYNRVLSSDEIRQLHGTSDLSALV